MSTQLLSWDWKPETAALRRFDGATNYQNLELFLKLRTQSFLLFPGRDSEAEIQREHMQVALSMSHIYEQGLLDRGVLYQRLRQYHIDPLGGDMALARGRGVDTYGHRFDAMAIAVKCVGAAICFVSSGEEHHGGASISKAKRFVRRTFGMGPTELGECWKNLAPVSHICGALYHLWGADSDLWTAADTWRAGWVAPKDILTLLETARDFERRIGAFSTLEKYRSGRSVIQYPGDVWSVRSIIGDDFPHLILSSLSDEKLKEFFPRRNRREHNIAVVKPGPHSKGNFATDSVRS